MSEHSQELPEDYVAPTYLNTGPLTGPNLPEGFPFGSESYARRLIGPEAALMLHFIGSSTILYDRVAAGIAAESTITQDPWGRLMGTGRSAAYLSFGNEEETSATAERMYLFHNHIKGVHRGVSPSGEKYAVSYNANDAEAQQWVSASNVKGVQKAIERWGKPLNPDEWEGLYQDLGVRFGLFFGIPEFLIPKDATAFDAYWNNAIESKDMLLQTPVSHEMVDTIFRYANPKMDRRITDVFQAITITSLDKRLQDRHPSLKPTEKDIKIAKMVDTTVRHTLARMPQSARESFIPAYFALSRKKASLKQMAGKLATASSGRA